MSTQPVREGMMYSEDAIKGIVAVIELKQAAQLLLDHVDYTAGACKPTSMVAAVLPKEIIERVKQAISPHKRER